MTDWREPKHRRLAFQLFYQFHLKYRAHPGMVYSMLPRIAEHFDLDEEGRAWLVWLNGNTQNVVTSFMLLETAPTHHDWRYAVDFWNDNFKTLEWDTDRRHQKSKFGEATEQWYLNFGRSPAEGWNAYPKWEDAWKHSKSQPYMGRLSAWSMLEYARILLGANVVPDAATWLLDDVSGSQSHRNGIAFVAGHNSVYWDKGTPDLLGIVPRLETFADELLAEADMLNHTDEWGGDVSRLTMESALCTYKSWHKPNRRYPGCYADMMYNRIRKAEARFGRTFDMMWDWRQEDLPWFLRLEDNPNDPGLAPTKQNYYLNTGEPVALAYEYPDTFTDLFEREVRRGAFGPRKDPSWI